MTYNSEASKGRSKWAGPWENVSFVICEQQRCRSACASAQSDQRLYCSLLRYYNISRFYSRNFKTLASFCGCAGRLCLAWSETPEYTFCRDVAQIKGQKQWRTSSTGDQYSQMEDTIPCSQIKEALSGQRYHIRSSKVKLLWQLLLMPLRSGPFLEKKNPPCDKMLSKPLEHFLRRSCDEWRGSQDDTGVMISLPWRSSENSRLYRLASVQEISKKVFFSIL